jgi:acetyltransferase-like isoleucine patch superfamily enzyme
MPLTLDEPLEKRTNRFLTSKFWRGIYYYIRSRMIISRFRLKADERVIIMDGFHAFYGKNIILGKNIYIGRNAEFHAGETSTITIGGDSFFGPSVYIDTHMHNFQRTDVPMKKQGRTEKDVVVGRDVWIGAKAVILNGITIGEGAIVAAGAVVTKDVEPYTIVAGVPALPVKNRKE